MSAYAGQWELLGESGDPWPGDVGAVDRAAGDYRDLASSIRDQVARLRSVASGGNELVGEYAPELQKSSEDLADYLQRAEGRFDTVATALTQWSPELDRGQRGSRSMVDEAERLHSSVQSHLPPSSPVDTNDSAAVAADQARARTLSSAQGDLDAVVARFRTLRGEVDQTASTLARRINDASHDSLKNHRFDGVRQWVHDHVDLLKKIADVLTFIATVIVVAALIIGTGGLALAAILTAGALLVHTILAANGDGSWADVAIDAFALATFGVGKVLTSAARGALAMREGMAAYSSSSALARTLLSEASGLSKVVTWASRSNPVFRTINSFAAGTAKFGEVMNAEYKAGLSWRLVYGDKEAGGLARAIAESASELGPGRLLNGAQHLMNASVPVWRSAVFTDFTFKGLNDAHLPLPFVHELDYGGYQPWVEWKEAHTVVGLNP